MTKPSIVIYLEDLKVKGKVPEKEYNKILGLLSNIVYNYTFDDQLCLIVQFEKLCVELNKKIKDTYDLIVLIDNSGEKVFELLTKNKFGKSQKINVKRTRDENWNPVGIISSSKISLDEQITNLAKAVNELLKNKDRLKIAFIDDVVFSGSTIKFCINSLKEKLKENFTKINIEILALTALEKNDIPYKMTIGFIAPGPSFDGETGTTDIMCVKDFIWKEFDVGERSYINNEKWMKEWYFKKPEKAKECFLKIKKLTKSIFKGNKKC